MFNKVWTEEMVEWLKENFNYERETLLEITNDLNAQFKTNLTINSIRNKAYKLRLKKIGCRKLNRNYKPIGKEIIVNLSHKKGEKKLGRMVKVNSNTWKRKKDIVWEQFNGKIPTGYSVIFCNGNYLDDDISNLYLVNNEQLGWLCSNGFIHEGITKEFIETALAYREFEKMCKK